MKFTIKFSQHIAFQVEQYLYEFDFHKHETIHIAQC